MYLGIDIGTSNVKAVVVDEDQRILGSASAPIAISRPDPLWSEQNPEDWWAAVEQSVADLRRALGGSFNNVRAIGLSGQMHGVVLLDVNGMPLRPAILHNDGRSHVEARQLNELVPDFGHVAGVPAMPGFAAPKLLWLKRHEPEILARASVMLLPKDYVRYRMTGSFATDASDGSGTVMLDSGRREWSAAIAAACGVSLDLLPPVLEGPTVSGQLAGAVANAWGLKPGTPVAAGGGDAAAGAIGIGSINEGDGFISMGTAAQYFITRESYRPAPQHLVHSFAHALPGRWFQMAALLNGASCLSWVAKLLGQTDIDQLLASTEAEFKGPSPVLFLPYLTGERSPHNNPHATGVLFGLRQTASPQLVTQAVLEGVALALADCQGYLADTGPLPATIGVTGGGSKSRFWMKILASAIGRTVLLYEGGEAGPAFGAARIARLSVTGEDPGLLCRKPPIAAEIVPDAGLVSAYGERLERFRSLYRALESQF